MAVWMNRREADYFMHFEEDVRWGAWPAGDFLRWNGTTYRRHYLQTGGSYVVMDYTLTNEEAAGNQWRKA